MGQADERPLKPPTPVRLRYEGQGRFVATSPYWLQECEERFRPGTSMVFDPTEERSSKSHRHYFASIKDAFDNLPDEMHARFPNVEALRKHALIAKGWCDSQTVVCTSAREAQRMARFMRPSDASSLIDVKGTVITRYTAKSQSTHSMKKDDFQRSKDDVLDYIAHLLGTTRAAIERNQPA